MRRRPRATVGLVVLALVGVVAAVLWPSGPRPCRATFKQVREGMSFEEVCATVGAPPGDFTDGEYHLTGMPFLSLNWRSWRADGVELMIWLEEDRVTWLSILPLQRHIDFERAMSPGPWNRLRARLGF
jgi:hypothetical protein